MRRVLITLVVGFTCLIWSAPARVEALAQGGGQGGSGVEGNC
jgi:hypothetical protein